MGYSLAHLSRQLFGSHEKGNLGRRGFGSPFTHQLWNLSSADDYLTKEANEQIIVCVQIESKDAVENLEEIAKTPGIGTWFYILSLSRSSSGF